MEKLVNYAISNKTVTYFAAILIFIAGLASYSSLGKLEDPDFTVKTGVIVTSYPGASPEEVEQEVTNKIEEALQEMPQMRFVYSLSKAGLSVIKVDIKQEYWADRLPQVWDEMRKKIRDVTPQLPPGCSKPDVMDDFSFVYGFVLSVTGDGYNYAELESHTKAIQKELNLVPGVSRVELWGTQPKVIYIDVSEQQLAQLGVSSESLLASLTAQNLVLDAGSVEIQDQRFRVQIAGDFDSVATIENLPIYATLPGALASNAGPNAPNLLQESKEIIRVRDVATVRRGYLEPPLTQMRFNGQPALAISIANITGGNILDTGNALEAALDDILPHLPVGIEVERIAWQSKLVEESINGFMINLVEAILIVLVVVAIGMGLRMGVIIGTALVLTILGTFVVMAVMGIDLHRVSLGSLVIALGMMVDNAIVVADNYAVALRKGVEPRAAALSAAARPSIPLLGATFIAVMAFYPIYSATADAGEYAASLFIVVGISLLLSWLIALTFTPLQCMAMLKPPAADEAGKEGDEYKTGFFRAYRRLLEGSIRYRYLTMAVVFLAFLASIFGFKYVDRVFFTDATRTQFMVNYWAPEGTRTQQVAADMKPIEDKLLADPRVESVSMFVGSGGPRFYLPVDPELPYASYGELIVNTKDLKSVTALVDEYSAWLAETTPQALTRVRKYTAGPGYTWPFEARFSGPADADPQVLRELAEQGMQILNATPMAKEVRTDMRQRTRKVVADYDSDRGRWTGVSRVNVAQATRTAFDGMPVGIYREGDQLQPIMVRFEQSERENFADTIRTLQVRPTLSQNTVPLDEVVNNISMEWEDPIIVRWNRRRAVTVNCAPNGVTFPTLFAEVKDQFEAIPLPPGYKMEWRGEQFGTVDSQQSLIPGMIPSFVIMLFIVVALFNAWKPPAIIFGVVPLALIGITVGLLISKQPFSFMALLGAMSLAGMMIKNAIVLIDEISSNGKTGKSPYDSVVDAGISRLRPVMLGAITTVLGVAPLVQDIFWVAMSVTIMAGLTFGTVLTMIIVPTLYAILHKIPSPIKK